MSEIWIGRSVIEVILNSEYWRRWKTRPLKSDVKNLWLACPANKNWPCEVKGVRSKITADVLKKQDEDTWTEISRNHVFEMISWDLCSLFVLQDSHSLQTSGSRQGFNGLRKQSMLYLEQIWLWSIWGWKWCYCIQWCSYLLPRILPLDSTKYCLLEIDFLTEDSHWWI